MSISKQHFDCNHNCFAEFDENQQNVIVYSFKEDKCWTLTAEHYYLYRIYCNPLKDEQNPYNIFIGRAKDLVGFKKDHIHSNTHINYLYDIVEITRLPLVKGIKPMQTVQMLQQFIPNLSFNPTYKTGLDSMRQLRTKLPSGKVSIFHWLMTAKTVHKIQKIQDKEFIFTLTAVPSVSCEESIRHTYMDRVYDIVCEHLRDLADVLADNVAGVLYQSQCIPLADLKSYSEGNTEKLFELVKDIIKTLSAKTASF